MTEAKRKGKTVKRQGKTVKKIEIVDDRSDDERIRIERVESWKRALARLRKVEYLLKMDMSSVKGKVKANASLIREMFDCAPDQWEAAASFMDDPDVSTAPTSVEVKIDLRNGAAGFNALFLAVNEKLTAEESEKFWFDFEIALHSKGNE